MKGRLKKLGFVMLFVGALVATGCSEVQGRRKIGEANKKYREGQYAEAAALFEEAERLVPQLPVLWLNKGFNCRQMVVPGSKSEQSVAGAKCALTAFKRYQELLPQDVRGETLYVQTLFDADEFETLAKMYEARFAKNNTDIEAINGLVQVYGKWRKVEETLNWYEKKAELQSKDPEAQYSVGVFLWQQLFQNIPPEFSIFDPRLDPNKSASKQEKKIAPLFPSGTIATQQRIDYADKGISYLTRAVELRPKYHEAMTYINLLYRQKSFAFFDAPDDWQKAVDSAKEWYIKSLQTQGKEVPANLLNKGGAAVGPAVPGAAAESATEADDKEGAPTPDDRNVKKAHRGKRGGKS